ncbi:amidohydrolase [Leifsonia sp. NPDC102414]|uniref:amidohydrolase n=1 Tax=Leifsonia sp. NPDC102414 TaxID=3364124 RepID=UPI0037F32EA3
MTQQGSSAEAVLLRGARLPGVDGEHDVLLRDGAIVAVGDAGSVAARDISAAGTVRQVQLDGRWIVPGLWDQHVHFTQWAQTARRLDISRARSAAEAADLVCARIAAEDAEQPRSPAGGSRRAGERAAAEPLVGFGFHDALWPDQPTRALLDAAADGRAVVLIAGDLHCSWLSTAAARRFAPETADDPSAAVLREDASFAVTSLLAAADDATLERWAAEAASAAAARGVVGIVDLEYGWNLEVWQRRMAGGASTGAGVSTGSGASGGSAAALRVEFGVYPDDLERAIAAGLRTGDVIDGTDGLLTVGPAKIISDGSLNTRTALCVSAYPDGGHGIANLTNAELVEWMRRAASSGIEPTVHAIGDRANTLALDAFETVGCRGRIEHAQLVSAVDVPRFARLGVTASVQPEHAMDDRDVADALWAGRTDRAFPLAELHASGATIAFGSDAPVAPLDPWIALSAAVTRSRDGRSPWHPEQALSREAALRASTRSSIRAGQPADIAVLDADPFTCLAADLRGMPVAATLLAGRFTHDTLGWA